MLVGYFLLVSLIGAQGFPYLVRSTRFWAKIFLIFVFIELWWLAFVRAPGFITDDLNYLPIFYIPQSCYMEKGYCMLNWLLSCLGQEPYVWFGGMALLIFGSIFLFIYRYSPNVVLSVLAYVCLMYIFNSLNIVRQFLALAIILCTFQFVQKRQFFPFLCAIVCASLFHRSAIFCISIYWLYNMKVNKKNVVLLVLGSIVLFLSFGYLAERYTAVGGVYSHYLVDAEQSRLSSIIRLILNFIIMVVVLCVYKKNCPVKDLKKLKIDFLVLCSCISTAGAMISLQAYHVERLMYYFYFFNIITLPSILERITNKEIKALLFLSMLLCLVAYGAIVLYSWEQKGILYSFYF